MKKRYISKTLISISMISMIIVGCGKDNKREVYKVKLENVNSASLSMNIADYRLHGTYVNCFDKEDNSSWILQSDVGASSLEVAKDDTACKLNLTKVEIGTGNSSKSYNYSDPASNTLNLFKSDSIKFSDNVNAKVIYITAVMTPDNYSAEPSIEIKITESHHTNPVELTPDKLVYLKGNSLSVIGISSPEYTFTSTNLNIKFLATGFPYFFSDLVFTVKNGGQKASSYFILVNDTVATGDYKALDDFHKKPQNAARIKSISPSADTFSISKAEINSLIQKINTQKPQNFELKIVLVNTQDGKSSYNVDTIKIKKPAT
ncbi:hypothetical protein [Fluviispira sanaruensis]|uniref:Uncharacterized protein n=1 Tax=Fluviispira sanaruensis TaxID=2493639 RepID=A0A4P2VNL3_FLUSA|nr:hypothetical protein [Fluviispira sanaruensis]BBH54478.1 hypothetical protein JCM31447_29490 [Fluviispira sanaruensis]